MNRDPWPLDQPIPRECSIEDVCRILQISRSTFERHAREFLLVELQSIGRLRRFDGASVARARRGRLARTA